MTKHQAIQSAYTWAWNTHNDKKSPTMAVLCAKQVLDAIELYGSSPDACHEILSNLLKDWRAAKRQGFKDSIERLSRMLEIGEESAAS